MGKTLKSRRKEKRLVKKNLYERESNQNIEAVIRYLGLNEATPNTGTKNKRDLMVRALILLKDWESGSIEEWSNRLSLRLNISARTAKENYIDPLIHEGIIKKEDSRLVFYGLPSGIQENAESEEE